MSLLSKAQERAADPITVESGLKTHIGEIVRAYRHSWDIYAELLQNSVDAINRRFRILNDPDFYLYDHYRDKYQGLESGVSYSGCIKIVVDIPERTIEVWDNGVGIQARSIEEFLYLPEEISNQPRSTALKDTA